nr:MAG TPA: N-acetylmuramoyl-L-alanine amidase [Caudoviricetes sp.]
MNITRQLISNRSQLGGKRPLSAIKFIVIHDTANTGKGADAMAHYRYLQHTTRAGSAHYYVDDKEIVQTIDDSVVAWAVGDKWARKNATRDDVTNYNSISVELCINQGIDKDKAYDNLLWLTRYLMQKYHAEVVRHFDATGKPCPKSWQSNNWSQWWRFKKELISMPSKWAEKDWNWAVDNHITDGSNPQGQCTREQVVSLLKRMYDLIKREVQNEQN